ncbi:MAG: phosphohydrolase [Pirellulaceae bacterium]|nr:MAG: phosphohydrolase [Pirellulaceae bacterium]
MSVGTKPAIDLNDLLASAQLPALPQTAIRLIELSQDAANGPKEYARPIEADVGLMGQVLRFVNSSYFGFSREIASVQQALALVGVRTIKNFVLWSAVFALVPDPKFGPFDLKKLWQDSLRRALFARNLGRWLKLNNSEDLFAAALLQDMAIPLLLKELPEQYEELVERRTSEGARLSDLEREVFGWDHAQAAAALARNWQLPDAFARLIERHPCVESLLASDPPELDAACVALAALLPACQDERWPECEKFLEQLRRISPDAAQRVEELFVEVDTAMEEFAPLMNLAVPAKSLRQWWHEAEPLT